ncbi:MAG: 16S rRNA (adenine(1518)-N(6)/adenine(1519)-N(6))-dimethyltransferase [Gammaproteobacteria bacterium]|nr:MAG: 16S rRNA (adenine(1518)-N(6)/adenine(1519)-N(6))-dimethyltransferase [Gammaproteobacteria bacterium]
MPKSYQGHTPRKRFGQNFLVDEQVISQITTAVNPQKNDTIVEIGPGLGAITEELVAQCDNVSLVELDRDLAAKLQARFTPEQAQVYAEDALKFDFNRITEAEHELRIIGNLPYNISTPLLFHIFSYNHHVKDMFFMLQKELVDRITAPHNCKQYGRLSVISQYHCDTEYLFTVPPHAFNPQPKVQSAIIKLSPKPLSSLPAIEPAHFSLVVSKAFNQRRKTLRNALKGVLDDGQIADANVNPKLRAENLSVDDFVRLSEQYDPQRNADQETD